MVAANQNPYWPESPVLVDMAVAYPYQDPRLADHASIRKLHIKLGGRFSDSGQPPNIEGMNLQYPLEISTTQRLYENSTNTLSSAASINSFTDACSSLLCNQYYNGNGAGVAPISQGPSSFPMELSDVIYSNPQRLEQLLDCYYGAGMMNEGNGTNSAESTSWDDLGGSVYPSPLSNCAGYQQHMLQECLLSDAKYMASQ